MTEFKSVMSYFDGYFGEQYNSTVLKNHTEYFLDN